MQKHNGRNSKQSVCGTHTRGSSSEDDVASKPSKTDGMTMSERAPRGAAFMGVNGDSKLLVFGRSEADAEGEKAWIGAYSEVQIISNSSQQDVDCKQSMMRSG